MTTVVADRVILDTNVLLAATDSGRAADVECAGKQVHDANVVATMLVHGIDTIATINVGDFARYEPRIVIVTL